MLAVVAGVAIGLPIGLSGFAMRATLPLILLIYSIPQVTILPLFVLYFGIGAGSKIAFGVSHGIFPIILNVIAGVQSVEAAHLTAARSMGATRLQTIRRVVLPHMTPSLFTGLRLAMSGTLLGVMLAELYVSTGGIGYYSPHLRRQFRSACDLRAGHHAGADGRGRSTKRCGAPSGAPHSGAHTGSTTGARSTHHCTNFVVNICSSVGFDSRMCISTSDDLDHLDGFRIEAAVVLHHADLYVIGAADDVLARA